MHAPGKRGFQLCPPRQGDPVVKLRTQADRVLARWGCTPPQMAAILGYAPSTVYRWTYSTAEGGTGGLVPTAALRQLSELARAHGVLMRDEDFNPAPLP